jgi:hypothetical protein
MSDYLLWFPLLNGEGDKFAYVYMSMSCYTCDEEMCIVRPFGVRSEGHARDNSGRQIRFFGGPIDPIDRPDKLHQGCMGSELLESHAVQLRKVVMNWAEQVEMGRWELMRTRLLVG